MTPSPEAVRELERFDADLPIEKASTPPASWYLDPEFFELEHRSVFPGSWWLAARTDQLATPGSFVCAAPFGDPLVVVRGRDRELRAFYNVCRHHGAELVAGEGRIDAFVCPYHGWSYDLDGRLRRAPGIGGVDRFARSAADLVALSVATLGPLVFVCPEPRAPGLEAAAPELEQRLSASGIESLHFAARRRYELACNWKVVIDNYLDGGYHVAQLHRGLAAQLDLGSYRTEVAERSVLQTVRAGPGPSSPEDSTGTAGASASGDFPERVGEGALYAWLYPAVMLNRYGPVLDTNAVVPRAPERTEIVYDYYFADPSDAELYERSLRASDAVQREDTRICESVQRGLRSRGFDRGRYAPRLEAGAHHFHRLLARDLRRTRRP